MKPLEMNITRRRWPSWNMGLVNPEVADKHTRTILVPGSRDAKSYVPDAHRLKLNNDELANGLEIVRAIFQLRPLKPFLACRVHCREMWYEISIHCRHG